MFDTRRQKIVHKGLAIVTVKGRQTASGQRGCNALKGKNEAGKGNGLPAVAGIPLPYASKGEAGSNRVRRALGRYKSLLFTKLPNAFPSLFSLHLSGAVFAITLSGFGGEKILLTAFTYFVIL